MKIARYEQGGVIHYGQVIDEGKALQRIDGTVLGAWHLTGDKVALPNVRLLTPVAPPNIIAIGLNYKLHAAESNSPLPDHPVVFVKLTTALCDPGMPIVLPMSAPNEVDYECELAIVIGR
ncbi:MAG: DUF2437 domain-containing protein, partial [Chloroflexi bacterium]|nr:DUF2437 domain-containing protein [Chloroflexota bacterium]